jgi:hypothetical protein
MEWPVMAHAGTPIKRQSRSAYGGQATATFVSVHVVGGLQQTPLSHAFWPVQLTLHSFTLCDWHIIGAWQTEPPSQVMSHVDEPQSMPPPQALAFEHWILQIGESLHVTLRPQLEAPKHRRSQLLACVQSMPPAQEGSPVH